MNNEPVIERLKQKNWYIVSKTISWIVITSLRRCRVTK